MVMTLVRLDSRMTANSLLHEEVKVIYSPYKSHVHHYHDACIKGAACGVAGW